MRLFLSNNIYFLTNSDTYSKNIVQSLQFLLLKQDSFFLVGGTAEPEDDPESFHRDILRYDPDSEQLDGDGPKAAKPRFCAGCPVFKRGLNAVLCRRGRRLIKIMTFP